VGGVIHRSSEKGASIDARNGGGMNCQFFRNRPVGVSQSGPFSFRFSTQSQSQYAAAGCDFDNNYRHLSLLIIDHLSS